MLAKDELKTSVLAAPPRLPRLKTLARGSGTWVSFAREWHVGLGCSGVARGSRPPARPSVRLDGDLQDTSLLRVAGYVLTRACVCCQRPAATMVKRASPHARPHACGRPRPGQATGNQDTPLRATCLLPRVTACYCVLPLLLTLVSRSMACSEAYTRRSIQFEWRPRRWCVSPRRTSATLRCARGEAGNIEKAGVGG